jgi:hypothetical protein
VQPKFDAGANQSRLNAQSERGGERVGADWRALTGDVGMGRRSEHLERLTRADRALDVDRRRLEEVDLNAVIAREHATDDLLLHLPIERDPDLAAGVVLAHVDQRVLLGQLGECGAQSSPVRGVARGDDRLQRRRRELVLPVSSREVAESVADLDLGQPDTFAISPAEADARCTAPPGVNELSAVTRLSAPSP